MLPTRRDPIEYCPVPYAIAQGMQWLYRRRNQLRDPSPCALFLSFHANPIVISVCSTILLSGSKDGIAYPLGKYTKMKYQKGFERYSYSNCVLMINVLKNKAQRNRNNRPVVQGHDDVEIKHQPRVLNGRLQQYSPSPLDFMFMSESLSFIGLLLCRISIRDPSLHYNDVIMRAMMSQITGVSIVWSTVCWGADLLFVREWYPFQVWNHSAKWTA